MSEFPISEEGLEAATKALEGGTTLWGDESKASFRVDAELAIQAFLTAEAFEVDELRDYVEPEDDEMIPIRRLVSPWKPVSGGGDE